jgi:hypothetical protein
MTVIGGLSHLEGAAILVVGQSNPNWDGAYTVSLPAGPADYDRMIRETRETIRREIAAHQFVTDRALLLISRNHGFRVLKGMQP